eukprot:3483719-Karenia_brevis.AAC.1
MRCTFAATEARAHMRCEGVSTWTTRSSLPAVAKVSLLATGSGQCNRARQRPKQLRRCRCSRT